VSIKSGEDQADSINYKGSRKGFKDIDVKREVLKEEIGSQLTNIVEKGLLNEQNNYYLSLEKALGMIVKAQGGLHGIKNKDHLKQCMPIAIDKVEYGIKYNRAHRIFSAQIFHEKGQKSGSSVTYSFTIEDRKLIHELSHEAAIHYKMPESNVHYVGVDEQETLLRDALDVLKQRSNVIDETILPDEDDYGRSGYRIDDFTDKTLEHALSRLFSLFLDEYKKLIEFNFPTLKESFTLYTKMPVHLFVVMYPKDVNSRVPRRIEVHQCSDEKLRDNNVIVCKPMEVFVNQRPFTLNYREQVFEIDISKSYYDLFSPSLLNRRYLDKHSSSLLSIQYIDDVFLVLRDLVYRQISYELPDVLTKLYGQYGISVK
jgi:hypothetical protein